MKGESPTLILENISNLNRLAFDIDDFLNSHQDGGNMSVLRTLQGRTIPSMATWCKSKRTSDHKLTWKSEKMEWKKNTMGVKHSNVFNNLVRKLLVQKFFDFDLDSPISPGSVFE